MNKIKMLVLTMTLLTAYSVAFASDESEELKREWLLNQTNLVNHSQQGGTEDQPNPNVTYPRGYYASTDDNVGVQYARRQQRLEEYRRMRQIDLEYQKKLKELQKEQN